MFAAKSSSASPPPSALSRSMFSSMVPPHRSGEFFGFYNMMGKFATVVGPLLVAVVALATGSSRASIASLVLLFIAGGLLLMLGAHTIGKGIGATPFPAQPAPSLAQRMSNGETP